MWLACHGEAHAKATTIVAEDTPSETRPKTEGANQNSANTRKILRDPIVPIPLSKPFVKERGGGDKGIGSKEFKVALSNHMPMRVWASKIHKAVSLSAL
jgi:hypothetical protein